MASGVFSAGAARLAGKTVLVVRLHLPSLCAPLESPRSQRLTSRSPSADWCFGWNRSRNRELLLMNSTAPSGGEPAAGPSANRVVRSDLPLRPHLVTDSKTKLRLQAIAFARAGASLILTARRQAKLEEVKKAALAAHKEGATGKGGVITCLTLDMQDRAAIKCLIDRIPDELKNVDVLVNNVRVSPTAL